MSELICHSDPVSALMKPFDVALRLTALNGAARELFGLEGVSEKIVGRPGWYLWFSDLPGAYQLELVRAVAPVRMLSGEDAKPDRFAGAYAIKCYPSCDDAQLLGSFSTYERIIRQSEFFDATGAPDIAVVEDLPDSLFVVGTLEIESFPKGNELALLLDAPERGVTYVSQSQILAGPDGNPLLTIKSGSRDRNVPAWDLSWRLLDRLLKILLSAYRAQPDSARFVESMGFSYWVNARGSATPKPDGKVKRRRLKVHLRIFDSPFQNHRGARTEDLELATCLMNSPAPGRERRAAAAIETSEWISPEWWHVADYPLPELEVVHC
jgi:hypothetical protein